jgi:membrane fusion protein, multidrug efflux system
VVTVEAVERDLVDEVEALGTTRAREAVEITPASPASSPRSASARASSSRPARCWWSSTTPRSAPRSPRPRREVIDSRAQFRRARELLESKTVSESQVQQLEATMNADEARLRAAEARFEQTLVRAPFAGKVGLRQVSPAAW